MPSRARCIAQSAVCGIFLLGPGAVARADNPPWKIDERIAQRLAAQGYGADEKWFDYDPGLSPPFFVFYGLTESDGSFGYFAVNPWTGDVWDLWGCRKLSTPALRKSQAELRRHSNRREIKQYRRLARLRPECI